ncbi:hypothetical protein NDI45_12770 [Leptolyngbya sp. GB1-A1]|uniref:hypothetical protein n=1 Tax=Leptolyngbya sp. GB1-A1 TaxID=2933908 RepID=UPI00329A794E
MNFVCAIATIASITGIVYLLNPEFNQFVDTEVTPPIASWSGQKLPTWEKVKESFQQGFEEER